MERSIKSIFVLLALVSGFASCGSDPGAPASTTSGTSTGLPDISAVTNSGITISSNKLINSYTTDMCTQYTGESCIFVGGQVVRFSDGTVLATGAWRYLFTVSGDTDTDDNTVTVIVPSTTTAAYQRLSIYVASGSGYKSIYLVYIRSSDSFQLAIDSDADGVPDTTVTTLTESNWS